MWNKWFFSFISNIIFHLVIVLKKKKLDSGTNMILTHEFYYLHFQIFAVRKKWNLFVKILAQSMALQFWMLNEKRLHAHSECALPPQLRECVEPRVARQAQRVSRRALCESVSVQSAKAGAVQDFSSGRATWAATCGRAGVALRRLSAAQCPSVRCAVFLSHPLFVSLFLP